MNKNIIVSSVLLMFLLTGCAVFKSERQSIIPKQKQLNSEQIEVVQEDAAVLAQIAEYIKEHGIQAGDERAIILADGTKIIAKYVGTPYKDVNGLDNKAAKRANERAKGIVDDYAQDRAEYSDELDKARDKQIYDVNHFWDWRKLFAGGIITWIFVAVAIPILSAFFPVIIPFVSLAWQGLKFGIKGLAMVARLGIGGFINLIKAIESFREAHKGTEVGKAFDTHMSQQLDHSDKKNLDVFKNHFDI